ncbi:MAG: hypothetical protein K8T20_01445 [Planctomycetes bacterium]|nr:hypothetical protein [Planctomycetota bacterium]
MPAPAVPPGGLSVPDGTLPLTTTSAPVPKLDPDPPGPSAENLRAQAAELRSRIAAAASAEDGRTLLGLVHRLVRLGEPGFEGAAEALSLLVAASRQEPPGLGIEGDELWRLLLNPDLASFEEWLLSDPSRGSSEMRAQAASCYCWQPDVNPVPLALARLNAETDPEVLKRLTPAFFFATRENFSAMADLARAQSSRPDLAATVLMWLGKKGGEEAWPLFQPFLDSPAPEIASQALIWSRILRPPVQGAVVAALSKDPDVPLQLGDIIVSWEGLTVGNAGQEYDLFQKWDEGAAVNVVVHRGDSLVPLVIHKKPKSIQTRSTLERK